MSYFKRYLNGPFLRELEPVFCGLIAWPDVAADGGLLHGFPVATIDDRREVLRLVCESLGLHQRKLPSETAQRIRNIVPGFIGTTNSDGAIAVLGILTFFDRLNQERKCDASVS